jgi:hypothetical protein
MAEPAKCAHPSCECTVRQKGPYGWYCSEHCKEAGQITELHCNCQHDECRHGSTHPGPITPERAFVG